MPRASKSSSRLNERRRHSRNNKPLHPPPPTPPQALTPTVRLTLNLKGRKGRRVKGRKEQRVRRTRRRERRREKRSELSEESELKSASVNDMRDIKRGGSISPHRERERRGRPPPPPPPHSPVDVNDSHEGRTPHPQVVDNGEGKGTVNRGAGGEQKGQVKMVTMTLALG
jgi:hypothetical protein